MATELDRQGRGDPVPDCYSNDNGDSWHDCPDDIEFVHRLQVGDEYEVEPVSIRTASQPAEPVKVPSDEVFNRPDLRSQRSIKVTS